MFKKLAILAGSKSECPSRMRRRIRGLMFFFTIFIISMGSASAAAITVDDSGGGDYTSKQAAVDNASAGDTIPVRDVTSTKSDITIIANSSINKDFTLRVINPNVWITDPSPTDFFYEPLWQTSTISQDISTIKAVELSGLLNITSTNFEYSTNQIDWQTIANDTYIGVEGYYYTNGSYLKIGPEGWAATWNLSNLPDGDYFIRVTMRDSLGLYGNYTRKIHFDRIPPTPVITQPQYGQRVNGFVMFNTTTLADNVVSAELLLFHGSPGWYRQSGLGNATQHDVGQAAEDGTNRYCAPTAAANALAGLGDDRLYPPGQAGNVTALGIALSNEMNTSNTTGTTGLQYVNGSNKTKIETDGMGSAIAGYLEKRGVGCSNNDSGYEVKTYKVTLNKSGNSWFVDPANNEISFKAYNDEIRRNQSVILFVVPVVWTSGPNSIPYINNVSGAGHALTGSGANTEPNGDLSTENQDVHDIEYVDPNNGQTIPSQQWNNYSGYNLVTYNGNYWMVLGMWAVSPKNTTTTLDPVAIDTYPGDGLITSWDSMAVEDGFYTLIMRLTDSDGYIASETIVIEVDNVPPLYGTVLDTSTMTKIAGGIVTTDTGVSNTTDEFGYYSLQVSPGTYNLTVTHEPDYYPNSSVVVEIMSGTLQNIELEKKPAGIIGGAVTSA